jgi:hypothetical protein
MLKEGRRKQGCTSAAGTGNAHRIWWDILGNIYLEDWEENEGEFQNCIFTGIGCEDLNWIKMTQN